MPDGEDAPPGAERPSLRLWGQRLGESFSEPSLARWRHPDGLTVSVHLDHPSVDEDLGGDVLQWFEHGTAGHLIPTDETKVVFWWGPPLRWGPGPGGVRASNDSEHWGRSTEARGYWAAPQGDFTGDAYDAIERVEEDAVGLTYQETLLGPPGESKYLERVK